MKTVKKSNNKFWYVFITFFTAYMFVGTYMSLWSLSSGLIGVVFRLSERGISIPLPLIENLSNGETVFVAFGVWSISVVLAIFLCCLEKIKFFTMKSAFLLVFMIISHLMSVFLFLETNQKDFDCWFHAVLAIIGFVLFIIFVTYQVKLLLKIKDNSRVRVKYLFPLRKQ